MKEYIDQVYQSFSKFTPLPRENIFVAVKCPMRPRTKENFYSPEGHLQENFYEQDPETGILYQEKPNWLGGETKPLSQGMADYIFENVNVPIGYK